MHGSSMPSVVPLVLLESKHTWVQSDPCGSTVVRVPVMLWLYRLGPWSGGLCRVGLHSASPTIPTIPEGLSARLRWPKSARCSLDRMLPGAAAGVWPSPGKSDPAVNCPRRHFTERLGCPVLHCMEFERCWVAGSDWQRVGPS